MQLADPLLGLANAAQDVDDVDDVDWGDGTSRDEAYDSDEDGADLPGLEDGSDSSDAAPERGRCVRQHAWADALLVPANCSRKAID